MVSSHNIRIKDMITESGGESGCMLLRALVSFVNLP